MEMGYWIVIALLGGMALFAWNRALRWKRELDVLRQDHWTRKSDENEKRVSQKEYRHILNQSADAIIVFDSHGRIVEANTTACQILLYEMDDLIDRNVFDVDTQFSQTSWRTFWQLLKKDWRCPLETDFIRKDGAPISFEAVYHYVDIKGKSLCFCVAHDISTLKKAKDQLLLAKDKIERLNSKLHKNVERAGKMAVKVQANKALKKELLDAVSFDIKTSLKSIMNMLDYLYKTAFGDTQQVFSQNAHSTAFGLLMTVNNILDATQMEGDDLVLDRVNFRFQSVIDRAFRRLRPLAKDRRVRLNAIIAPAIPEYLQGDAQRLERILFNLIVNSIQYNRTGDIYVRIKLLHQEQNKSFVEVTVKDHDTSESQDVEPTDKNYKNESEEALLKQSHEFKLRLSVSRSLIELMGGKIWFHHHVDKGPMYFFTLHLDTKDSADPTHDTYDLVSSEQGTLDLDAEDYLQILVSEDSFVHQQIIKLIIRSLGHHFTNVRSGETTLKRLKEKAFDILLIDLTTREGLETLYQVPKIRSSNQQLYIIGMTDLQHEEVQHCITQLGINDIITKPINEDELHLALKCAVAEIAQNPPPEPEPLTLPDRIQTPDTEPKDRFKVHLAHKDVKPLSDDEIKALVSLTGKKGNQPDTSQQGTSGKPHEIAEQAITQLKKNFIESTPEMVAQIKEAAKQADHEIIKSTALAIKASTAYFEATQLESCINQLIQLAEEKQYSVILASIPHLKDLLNEAIERLQKEQ